MLLATVLAAALFYGCGRSSTQSTDETKAARPGTQKPSPKTPFEQDVQYVRDGQFTYILVFSRKDGGVFDKGDVDYLKANSPKETNQWVKTEEGHRVIAGTNFEFTTENLDALRKRFNVEDYGSGK